MRRKKHVTEQTGSKKLKHMKETPASPRWNSSTKLVVAASFVVIIAGLLVFFRNIWGPLLLAFVMVYLLYPVADWFHKKTHLPWRLSVGILYLLLLVIVIGLVVWGGVTLVDQSINLFGFLEEQMQYLPDFLTDIGRTSYQIGPYLLDFQELDVQVDQVVDEVFVSLSALLASAGSLVGTIATGAAGLIANLVLVLLVSFFMLSESNGVASQIVKFNIPRYQYDIERMGKELSRVWDAFLRGQLTLILITILIYTLVLSILGLPYALELALLAGLARFLPYIGPAILWVVLFTVSIFTVTPAFGLTPFWYAVLVVAAGLVFDTLIDQMITPKLMGSALHVHPAALLIGAYVGASLLGFIGIMLAAPVLATLMLAANYALRKSFDLDPWQEVDKTEEKKESLLQQFENGKGFSWQRIVDFLWKKKEE
jgi:predicted PurR-regulated permease PerM